MTLNRTLQTTIKLVGWVEVWFTFRINSARPGEGLLSPQSATVFRRGDCSPLLAANWGKSCITSRKCGWPPCPVWVGFLFRFVLNPWTLQYNLEASRTNKSSRARVAAFVGTLVAGYFREAWPMCLGGVCAYWPWLSRGGPAVKGFHLQRPPSYRIRRSSLKQSYWGEHETFKTAITFTNLYIVSIYRIGDVINEYPSFMTSND